MITQIAEAIERYREEGLQCIIIHPERAAELYRDLATFTWRNEQTGEMIQGMPRKDFVEPDGAIARIAGVPVFEDTVLPNLWTPPPDRKRILFYVRRLQENGVNLLSGWTE